MFVILQHLFLQLCAKIANTKIELKKNLDVVDFNISIRNFQNFSSVRIDLQFEIIQDIKQIVVQIIIAVPNDPNSDNYDNIYFSSKVNFCKIGEMNFSSILLKILLDDFVKKAKFKLECPYRKVKII
jgi:hypothetical protein